MNEAGVPWEECHFPQLLEHHVAVTAVRAPRLLSELRGETGTERMRGWLKC